MRPLWFVFRTLDNKKKLQNSGAFDQFLFTSATPRGGSLHGLRASSDLSDRTRPGVDKAVAAADVGNFANTSGLHLGDSYRCRTQMDTHTQFYCKPYLKVILGTSLLRFGCSEDELNGPSAHPAPRFSVARLSTHLGSAGTKMQVEQLCCGMISVWD